METRPERGLRLWPLDARVQAALVVVLFVGSLVAVLFNALSTVRVPEQELQARSELREASRRMAQAATMVVLTLPTGETDRLDRVNNRLREVAMGELANFPGVEGGFYLAGALDRFSGYAFPTGKPGPHPEPPRNDPPPLEAPYIRLQVRQSLSEESGQPLFSVRDVGPSRVLVVTEPIGPDRPARATTWAMFRLTGPEQLQSQIRRYQVSVALALTGVALSLVLAATLARTLKRQRLAQERLRDELRRSEQLAALGTLLAGVAHEIRNPLAGIRSTIQLWERLPETARTTGSMEAVVQAVDRLNNILGRLLYFARADRAERLPIQVNQLLAETCALLEAQAVNQGVSLELDLQPNLPVVSGAADALRQVFLNLITNALQAMPHGGRLHCRTRHHNTTHAVEITVADSGRGVSGGDREHLFEPFFTTRPEGTGLGLALCREIVLQHGGTLELATQSGPGATFRVLLPAEKG